MAASANAKHPKFDSHMHASGPKAEFMTAMDVLGMKSVLNLSYSGFWSPEELKAYEESLRVDIDKHPDRFRFASSFSVKPFNQSDFAATTIAKLKTDFDRHNAVAVKIWKDMGMMLTDADGHYVFCDDKRFLPVYDYIAERGRVLYMHIADPLAAWQPLDPASPHYGYYKNHPEFHWYGRTDRPSHDEILGHRDALLERYPNMTFVAAHLASLEHDLSLVSGFLDKFPNAHVDTAGRAGDLMRMPNDAVRAFFTKYQDRVLYGSDWDFDEHTFTGDAAERAKRMDKLAEGFGKVFRYFEETLALPPDVLHKILLRERGTALRRAARNQTRSQRLLQVHDDAPLG